MSDPTCGILLERDGPIVRLTLDRPASRNSLDLPLALALRDAVRSLEGEAAPRALILRSSSGHFMAGGDVRRFDALLQDSPAACQAELARIIGAANETVARLTRLPCPVIGLVGGSAAGFGLSLALACDLTLAADDARFLFAYGAIGATPDGGASWHLPRRIGLQRALALALLNTPLDAEQALAAGLVCQVVPAADLDAAGLRLAGQLAAGAAQAQAGIKRLLRAALDSDLDTALDAEAASFLTQAGGADFAEGVRAFCERRPARFGPSSA